MPDIPGRAQILLSFAGGAAAWRVILGLFRQQKMDEWKQAVEATNAVNKSLVEENATLKFKIMFLESRDPDIRELVKSYYREKGEHATDN